LQEANWKIEEIEKEIRAQIELAIRKVPRVSHISGHMGCDGWDDEVKKLWIKLAKEYNLDIMPSDYAVKRAGGFGNAKTAPERVKKFIEMLGGLKPGTYLFVEHPGQNTEEMRAIGHEGYYDVAKDRDAVTEVFTSKEVSKAVERLNIKLISYKDLKDIKRK